MNKRGQTLFVSLMLGVILFLLGLALAYPLNKITQDAMAQTNSTAGIETALNCTTATTYQEKANCTVVDLFNPLWIGTLFGLGGLLISKAFL